MNSFIKNYIICSTIVFLIGTSIAYKSILECDACTYLVETTESYLNSNSTINEIETELGLICQHFSFNQTCQTVVDNYLPEVIQELINKETPQTVCENIGFCSNNIRVYFDEESLFWFHIDMGQ